MRGSGNQPSSWCSCLHAQHSQLPGFCWCMRWLILVRARAGSAAGAVCVLRRVACCVLLASLLLLRVVRLFDFVIFTPPTVDLTAVGRRFY